MLTSASSAYSNIVRRLTTLALCPDVHCAVTIHVQAISDHRALLCTKGQAIGEKTLSVFSYNHIYFYWLSKKRSAELAGQCFTV